VVAASFAGIAPLLIAAPGGILYDRFGPKMVFGCASVLVAGAALILTIAIAKNVFANRIAIQVAG
jgi:nitrate/nitrite transporter NarK